MVLDVAPEVSEHRFSHAALYTLALQERDLPVAAQEPVNTPVGDVGGLCDLVSHLAEQHAHDLLELPGIDLAEIGRSPERCFEFLDLPLVLRGPNRRLRGSLSSPSLCSNSLLRFPFFGLVGALPTDYGFERRADGAVRAWPRRPFALRSRLCSHLEILLDLNESVPADRRQATSDNPDPSAVRFSPVDNENECNPRDNLKQEKPGADGQAPPVAFSATTHSLSSR